MKNILNFVAIIAILLIASTWNNAHVFATFWAPTAYLLAMAVTCRLMMPLNHIKEYHRHSKTIAWVKGVLWGFPSKHSIMSYWDHSERHGKPLVFKSLIVVYPKTKNPIDNVIYVWHVAVKTVQPDVSYKTHAGWMQHLLIASHETISHIADLEADEQEQKYNNYRCGKPRDEDTVKTAVLENYEPKKVK